MDPLTISPSWIEHCEKLLPGFGFVEFTQGDNHADSDDEFLILTNENVRRLLRLPFGPFASQLAFNTDLIGFLDTFLNRRERLSPNQSIAGLDVNVFAVFYRFVADVPPGIKFSPGAKTSHLTGLHVITPQRFLRLAGLFANCLANPADSPLKDMFDRWMVLDPVFDKELKKYVQTWSGLRASCTESNATALRGIIHITSFHVRGLLMRALGGMRGNLSESLTLLSTWYKNSNTDQERGAVLGSTIALLGAMDAEQLEQFVLLITDADLSDELRSLLSDVAHADGHFLSHLIARADQLKIDVTRVEYACEIIRSFPESKSPGDIRWDAKRIVTIRPIEKERRGQTFGMEEEKNQVDSVSQLKEIAPHLGRYFCQRLLEACGGDLNRAVMAVMEGTIPSEVAHLDFAAEHEPSVENPPALDLLRDQGLIRTATREKTADELLQEHVDDEIKMRITSQYDKVFDYDDEYDDTLDGGGRVAVDTGSRSLDEDDPVDEAIEEADDDDRPLQGLIIPVFRTSSRESSSELSPRRAAPSLTATTVRPPSNNTRHQPSGAASARGSEGRQGQHRGGKVAQQQLSEQNPRSMVPVMEASVVDVNGERRNARGQLVEEDILMRPNLNKSREAPNQTTRVKLEPKAAVPLTPEQEAERIKRERARKERGGNKQRERGADKKQAKSAF